MDKRLNFHDSIRLMYLKWPWIVMNASLYAFCLPWIVYGIVLRYWIKGEEFLPGSLSSATSTFLLIGHMTLGAICLLLYPIQFIKPIRRKYPVFHRWSGRISLVSAIFTSIGGISYVCLKKFDITGGVYYGIAFFIAGLIFGGCAIMAGIYARKKDFVRHRYWAIRTYSQMLSPVLYRYWYLVMGGLGIYHGGEEGVSDCEFNGICSKYLETIDHIHAYTYFLVPLLFAELIIVLLKRQEITEVVKNEKVSVMYGAIENQSLIKESSTLMNERFFTLNIIGIASAVCCVAQTLVILVTMALGINEVQI